MQDGWMAPLKAKWRNFRRQRAAFAEFARCDPPEIVRIADDLGISANELEDRPLPAKWPNYYPNGVTIEAITA